MQSRNNKKHNPWNKHPQRKNNNKNNNNNLRQHDEFKAKEDDNKKPEFVVIYDCNKLDTSKIASRLKSNVITKITKKNKNGELAFVYTTDKKTLINDINKAAMKWRNPRENNVKSKIIVSSKKVEDIKQQKFGTAESTFSTNNIHYAVYELKNEEEVNTAIANSSVTIRIKKYNPNHKKEAKTAIKNVYANAVKSTDRILELEEKIKLLSEEIANIKKLIQIKPKNNDETMEETVTLAQTTSTTTCLQNITLNQEEIAPNNTQITVQTSANEATQEMSVTPIRKNNNDQQYSTPKRKRESVTPEQTPSPDSTQAPKAQRVEITTATIETA